MSVLLHYVIFPMCLFIVGILLFRVLGKKALAEMTGLEIFALLSVNEILTGPYMTESISKSLYYSVLFTLIYLLFTWMKRKKRFHNWFVASPTVLIRNGDILEEGLHQNRLTVSELLAMIRAKGFASPNDVEMATLEEIGQLSVIPKANARPIEVSDLQLSVSPAFISIPVIMEGVVLNHNLKFLKRDEAWLKKELKEMGYNDQAIGSITLASYTQDGKLQLDQPTSELPKKPEFYMPGKDN
ncbi:MAG TPA: YetF domain-containing protein [Candidatus Angelobacter sp.]|nr:YetF domain-containing protein [Candidatus Angelobacter sp.]